MRYFLGMIAIIVLMSDLSYSQTSEFMRESNNYKMGIGPIIGYKLGINAADVQQGIKNDIGTAGLPDFGASFYLPLNPDDKMGLFIDAVYGSYAYKQKYDNSSTDWTDRFSYITLGANFYISGFTVGVNMGIPMSAERAYSNNTLEIQTSTLNTMFEFKIGGNFTLNESNGGRFILFLNGSYQINGQFTDEVNLGTFNTHPASLQFGLGYLLNVD